MWHYFKNTRHYIDVLQNIVHAYKSYSLFQNATCNRYTTNARTTRENMNRRWKDNSKKNRKRKQKAKYRADDLVRVSRAKLVFEKGYEAK